MSADNGIYVLESPTKHGLEYRVAHCFAIDGLDYYDLGTLQAQAIEVYFFGKSEVYANAHDVMKSAIKLHNEVKYTEYGIRCIEKRKSPFPDMSWEEADNVLNGISS